MGGSSMMSIGILVLLLVVMYFLMIRPQKKREKETNAMRAGIQVGDEIVTIGGICAKVVKTKEETIVVQVGSDMVKMEMMRWAVSSVTKEAHGKAREVYDEVKEEDEAPKKKSIKRLKKDPVEEFEAVEEEIKEIEKKDEENLEAEADELV
jgi:preprotein translocase subunit YajC